MARESWGRRKMRMMGLSHGLFRILFALEWVVLPVVLSAPSMLTASLGASAAVDAEEGCQVSSSRYQRLWMRAFNFLVGPLTGT